MNTLPQLAEEIEKLKARCCCGSSFKTITYEKALTLIETSKVKPGTLYRITGVHKNKAEVTIPVLYDDGNNAGTTIYVWGLTKTEFSTEGWGEFWNPKYDQTNYGTLDLRTGTHMSVAGDTTGYTTATNVNTTGGTGTGLTVDIVVTVGVISSVIINNPGTGYIQGETILIDGGSGLAEITLHAYYYLYNIFDGENPDPALTGFNTVIGRKIIWGGYVWENISGQYGTPLSVTALDGDHWTKIAYNTTDYNFVIDYAEYDWANDWVLRRRQAEPVIDIIFPFQFWNSNENTQGIVLHGISVAQWGNKVNKDTELGSGLVICNDAYFEFCNFKGRQLLGATLGNYSFIKD
ncbi:MAG: hypothetical protein IT245_03210, partial [Bacteroidia bacterium]|nr:hypothetical protein [Bacteroidia bacterium]